MIRIPLTKIKNLSIGNTLSIAFGILTSVTFIVMGGNYIGGTLATKTIERTQKLRVPTAITSAQAEASLLQMFSYVRGYLATGESKLRDRYHEARQEFEAELDLMLVLSGSSVLQENKQHLQELQVKYELWKKLPERLFSLRDNYIANQPALKLLKDEAEVPIAVILQETATTIEQQSQRSPSQQNILLLKDLANFQSSFALLVSSLRGYLVTQEPSFRFEYSAQFQANRQVWKNLKQQKSSLTTAQQQSIDKIAVSYETFLSLPEQMFAIVEGERKREDLYLLTVEVEPLTAEILLLLQEIVSSQQEALSAELAKGNNILTWVQWQSSIAGAIALLMAILLAFWLRHKIAAPISRLTEVTTRIMHGDLEAQAVVESGDEIGTLASTFNQTIQYLKKYHADLAEYSVNLEKNTVELAKAKELAESANYAKSSFLANMSHELRTPLNVILGFSQVMSRDDTISPQQKETLDIINHSGEHLLALINDVLEVTKIEAGKTNLKIGHFDLYCLLDAIEAMLRLKAEEKGLSLVFTRNADVPVYIASDEGKVRQILINLINNAIKFTAEGSVTVSVSAISKNRKEILLEFTVEDTGVGIAPSEIKGLFEAFVQTESGLNSQQGTGLGLSIGRKFARLMGGDITAKSEWGQGSIFTFTLPVESVKKVAVTPTASRRAIALAPGQPEYRILIVEDILENRMLLDSLLAPLGFKINAATNGKEGIELWETWQPDLILMDMQMPVMNGLDATKYIKVRDCKIPIIALTASVFEDRKTEILAAGCDDFLGKPFQDVLLFEAIARCLSLTYIYETTQDTEFEATVTEGDAKLTSLSFMPDEWLEKVHQAACQLDEELLAKLIAEIPEERIFVKQNLLDNIENFDFDVILKLTKQD